MSFLRVPMSKGVEQVLAPEGEYELLIRSVTNKPSKNNRPMLRCMITFVGKPEFAPISHFLLMPQDGDPDDQVVMRMRNLRRFLTLFGIAYTDEGFDPDDLPGATAWGRVKVETVEQDGKEAYDANKLVLPRVQEDE